MAELLKFSGEPRDTSPLELDQLSDHELATIIEIERRLYEAQQSALQEKLPTSSPLPIDKRGHPYWAPVQVRHPRVLLLDGGRGTGKTSMLLTLIHRWSVGNNSGLPAHDSDMEAYRKRIERVQSHPKFAAEPSDFTIPTHVRVIGRILDFDPLPPEMPLIAGIMQAWQPLVEQYDEIGRRQSGCDEDAETLMDSWHRLFRVAAVGWTAIPQSQGLVAQVLDRQEQVADWQRLDERWQEFVYEVIERGRCLPAPHRFDEEPVFVIMIDDVDLQVERIRDLLPVLRMLYHPQVFFLVAAHSAHMKDMLRLEFIGQQNRLAHRGSQEDRGTIWAEHLALSSFEKVFPLRNRWELSQLSLLRLLEFPSEKDNFRGVLNSLSTQGNSSDIPLGDYLYAMAGLMEEVAEIPPMMSYRSAHQTFQQVSRLGSSGMLGMEALYHILAESEPEHMVRIVDRWRGPFIEYLRSGELAAHFQVDITHPISDADIIMSARPDFVYRRDSSSEAIRMTEVGDKVINFTSALVAATLREDRYDVTSGLRWEVRLALAWTRVRTFDIYHQDPNLDLAFQWRFHEHPSPKKLLEWAKEWDGFIRQLNILVEPSERLDRIAYGWIYHHLEGLGSELNLVPKPLSKPFSMEDAWHILLECDPPNGTPQERAHWKTRTLPLLARPELGLSVYVHRELLQFVREPQDLAWLWDQRRRLVTDAILAADEVTVINREAYDHERVEDAIKLFERRHYNIYNETSAWQVVVEEPLESIRRAAATPPLPGG
jgi:hypothetical protein